VPLCGLGSSVGITTVYRLEVTGLVSRWGRDFPNLSRRAMGPNHPPIQWVQGISRGKEWPGRDTDTSPLLVPWSGKSRAVLLIPL
jgi:hypothetical protein